LQPLVRGGSGSVNNPEKSGIVLGDPRGRPIRINLPKSSSPSVGARVVERGRVGLHGRPPWVAWRRGLVDQRAACPPTGDHEGLCWRMTLGVQEGEATPTGRPIGINLRRCGIPSLLTKNMEQLPRILRGNFLRRLLASRRYCWGICPA
jgi:hypothetical protein